jgi:molybdenum cofactor cytidylyltransferase
MPLEGHAVVEHAVLAALASRANPVIVVTGHDALEVERALAAHEVTLAHNPNFSEGLSTSLRAGLDALPDDVDGAVVLLGDMPRVRPGLIDVLISGFTPHQGVKAVVPIRNGRRGNPVLFGRDLFGELRALTGDVGGRGLLGQHGEAVHEVEVEDDGAFLDIDTPEALRLLDGQNPQS